MLLSFFITMFGLISICFIVVYVTIYILMKLNLMSSNWRNIFPWEDDPTIPTIIGYSTEFICEQDDLKLENLSDGKIKVTITHKD